MSGDIILLSPIRLHGVEKKNISFQILVRVLFVHLFPAIPYSGYIL